jgi:ABC-2 type transport system ATP-binding protein
MRIIATLDLPDSGDVEVCGLDLLANTAAIRPRIGWMPDTYDKVPLTTVLEYLDFYARAYGLPRGLRQERLKEVMSFTELESLGDRFVEVLSKGQSQRLSLARTLLSDPEVLILDEPAAGLDPRARIEFRHLVRLLSESGKSLFISSHILSELEDMCDQLIFIKDGKILHQGSAEGLKHTDTTGLIIDIKVCGDLEKLVEWSKLQPGVVLLETLKHGVRVECASADQQEASRLLKRMLNDGLEVFEFRRHERRLEEAFIDLVGKSSNTKKETL